MSDNQHKIKTAKNYNDMFTTYSYRNTHYKKQLHNNTNTVVVVCLLTKKKMYLYL